MTDFLSFVLFALFRLSLDLSTNVITPLAEKPLSSPGQQNHNK